MFSLVDAPHTLDLPGGRRMTWLEFGDPTGTPVILLHGTPGSRRQLAYADAPGLPHGRFIAIDRPGYGGSSIDLATMLDDTPADLARLADHLGIDEFFVMGVSGGAPTALAAAALLPARVRGVAAVSTAIPPHPDTLARERAEREANPDDSTATDGDPTATGLDGSSPNADLATVTTDADVSTSATETPTTPSAAKENGAIDDEDDEANVAPAPRRYSGRVLMGCKVQVQVSKWWPSLALRILKRQLAPSDVALLDSPELRDAFRADSRHPSPTTAEAILLDVDQCGEVWLLPLEEVSAPVAIWHGVEDRTVPVDRARELHGSLPTSTLHEIEGEGHFISFSHFGEILSSLVG